MATVTEEYRRSVAAAAAADSGGLDPLLLGDFLPALARIAGGGRRLTRPELQHFQRHGREAARQGVALRALLGLYLSAARRMWRHLPDVAAASDTAAVVRAGESMLRAAYDVVAAVTEGYQLARRDVVRIQEAARREFIDDLIIGRGEVADLLHRAFDFGLDLSAPHAVAVVRADDPFAEGTRLVAAVEHAVLGSRGDADALVTSKAGLLVVVFAAPDRTAISHVTRRLGETLGPGPDATARVHLHRHVAASGWQIGVGRARTGPLGVRASYDEARDAIDLAASLGLTDPVVDAIDLLAYQALLRDRGTVTDLVSTVLGPLAGARGGAGPLLDTLASYFATGANATDTARRMHLSARTVTYRLARVRALTGHDPANPAHRFTLQAAVLGARLIGWPG